MPTNTGRFQDFRAQLKRDISDQVPPQPERVQLFALRAPVEDVGKMAAWEFYYVI